MFRKLNKQETEQFRRWARQNYAPPAEISETWHPVVQAECRRMLEEHTKQIDKAGKNAFQTL